MNVSVLQYSCIVLVELAVQIRFIYKQLEIFEHLPLMTFVCVFL